jgi:uncharacterized protein DUF3127
MEYIAEGVVRIVYPMKTVGTNNFNTREIIIRTEEQYPQDLNFQFTQDKCDLLEMYKPGERVKISFNLRGKLDGFTNTQGETKYFNTVQGWKIQRADGQQPAQSAPAASPASQPQQVYVHTNTQYTEAALKANGWKEEALVEKGFGYFQPVTQPNAPAAPAAPKF